MRRTCTAVALIAMTLTIAGCSSGPSEIQREASCRTAARLVFPEVIAGHMTQAVGQAKVDTGCAGVDAVDRATILDAERSAAIVRATP
jgi:hypothetical protein